MRLNSDYGRETSLDIEALFTREDFTGRVMEMREAVALDMEAAHNTLQSPTPLPAPCGCILKGRSSHCTTFSFTNPLVPDYSVHDISRIGASKTKLPDLIARNILKIEDVPDDFPLSELQANQVRAAKTGRATIDRAAITEFLLAMRYPIAFLDYETYAAAIPRFLGYRPFDQIPFQFSLDAINNPTASLIHHEFLHTTPDNPDEALLQALRAALPKSGSIVVWNQTFERGINDKLGERNPNFRDWLADVDSRIVDLMDVFSMQAYVHPEFRGRTSIKSILPVLVPAPEFSYQALAIQEGATATARWNEIVTGEVDADTAAQVRSDLLAYCALDTRAMVEIWRELCRKVEPVRGEF